MAQTFDSRSAREEAPPLPLAALDPVRLSRLLRPLASPVRLRILEYLTTPHYLEEVASHLRVTRQAVRRHLDQLVEIGLLERHSGNRERGPVTEYVLNPWAILLIEDEFEKLELLRPKAERDTLQRTMAAAGRPAPADLLAGPLLSVIRGLHVGHRVPLGPRGHRTWVVGRDPRCEIALLHEPYASNRHAEIRIEGARYVLRDLRSTNGTQHNWGLMPRGGERELGHGDLIGVGKTLLLFWEKAPPAAP